MTPSSSGAPAASARPKSPRKRRVAETGRTRVIDCESLLAIRLERDFARRDRAQILLAPWGDLAPTSVAQRPCRRERKQGLREHNVRLYRRTISTA